MFLVAPVVPEMRSDTSPFALSRLPIYRGKRCWSGTGGRKNKA